jgi:hypothetical protein
VGYGGGRRSRSGEKFKVIEAITLIAEQRIREAMKQGVFDDLPCKGKPLDLYAEANIPPDLRMAYTLLKNGGYLDDGSNAIDPEKITSLENMLAHNPEERKNVRKMLKLTVIEFRMSRNGKRQLELEQKGYYEKVVVKIRIKKQEDII